MIICSVDIGFTGAPIPPTLNNSFSTQLTLSSAVLTVSTAPVASLSAPSTRDLSS